ncbi:MAG: hypothetical protein ACK51T_10770, partial [bacterium]
MHRDRGDAIAGAGSRLYVFLAEVVPHEVVANKYELRRHEPDLIAAAQEHRVLGREAQTAVDGDEAVVRADLDAGHGAGDGREDRFGALAQP